MRWGRPAPFPEAVLASGLHTVPVGGRRVAAGEYSTVPLKRAACKNMSSIWSLRFQCSASCKKKETHRQVTCIDARNSHVNDSFCDPSTRPPSVKTCRSRPCRYLVVTGDSSQVRLRQDVNTFCSWEKELSLKSGAVEPGGTLNVGAETGMRPVSGAKP